MSKIAIVTGSAGNLGSAVTREMVKSGFQVVGTIEPGKEAPESSAQIIYKPVDLMDPGATETFIHDIFQIYKRIDAVVCLVGGFAMDSAREADQDSIMKMITLNFFTALNTVQPVLSVLADQKERIPIILVGAKPVFDSGASKMTFSYTLSKSMVVKLAQLLNADPKNKANVSVIVPSIIDTPQNRIAMPDADFSDWVSPESIAEKIAFICDEGGKDLRDTVLKIYGNS